VDAVLRVERASTQRIWPLPREGPQPQRLDQSRDRRFRGLANEPRVSSRIDELYDPTELRFDCLRLGSGNRRLETSEELGDLAGELLILAVFRFVDDPSIHHRNGIVRPDVLQQKYEAPPIFGPAIGT
jgi:hypothetical protein